MNKNILIGTDDFEELIRNNGYYVDKTELIYELTKKNFNAVTLITRPRRFGKSLSLSMMDCFLDIRRNSKGVFRGLNILENHPDFCEEWMNEYPVLLISLKDVEGLTFEEAYEMLKGEIAKLCIRFADLEDEEKVAAADKAVFKRLMFKTASKEEIKNSLQTIMRMMKAVYGKKVILLLDEYDVPLAKARDSGNPDYYRQMLDMIRGILSISLKSNEFLKFAVVTGCLQISKERIFTGVNNFSCYSVTSKKYSSYYGFTSNEVADLLEAFDISEKMNLIREWYDGYIFGDTEVFCPWDVVRYTATVIDDGVDEPQNFWANTSSNDILNEFVNQKRFDVSDKLEILLSGGSITEEICEELTYDSIAASERNFWSVLLMTGYVSKADKSISKRKVQLRIPNAEISELFVGAVIERFTKTLDARDTDSFLDSIWNKDEETTSKSLTKILLNSISYNDYHEDYYHGMMNGIFISRGYKVKSNREAGLGRFDLRAIDGERERAVFLEFKVTSNEKDLDGDCEDALDQVIKKKYYVELPEGYDCLIYGIAFYKKMAKVKLLKRRI